jgi:hypothetical protein
MEQFKYRWWLFLLIFMGIVTYYHDVANANDNDDELATILSEVPAAPVVEQAPAELQLVPSTESSIDHAVTDTKKRKFAGWGVYTKNVRLICAALARDGRSVALTELLTSQIGQNPECIACDSFYKILIKNCRPAKVKKSQLKKQVKAAEKQEQDSHVDEEADSKTTEAIVEPTPTPITIILQREPRAELEVALQIFLERLEEDDKRFSEGQLAVVAFAKVLAKLSKDNTPSGAYDYFTHLSALIVSSEATPAPTGPLDAASGIQGLGPDNLHIGVASPADIDQLFN